MPPIALDPKEVHPYTLKSDLKAPEASRTVWQLSPLPARVRRALRNGAVQQTKDGVTIALIGTAEQDRVAYGVTGWSNWPDAAGAQVEFEQVDGRHGRRLPDSILDRLRDDEISELAEEVERLGDLDPTPGTSSDS